MAFHNVSLPPALQYGSVFGFGFATLVQETASGHEFRVARQSQARHRYRPIKQIQTTEEAIELKEFAIGRRGSLHSFRLKDWLDYTSNADGKTAPTMLDQVLGTGDGTTTQFQLLKVYDTDGDAPYTRTITLPVSGTVLVAVEGVLSEVTVSSAGVITLGAAPALGEIVTAGFNFDVPVRFETGLDKFAGMRLDAYGTWSMDALECVEVLDELEWPERWYPGGATDHGTPATDISLATIDGELHVIAQTASINAFLPAPDEIPNGPRVFVVHVKSTATGTVQLRDDDGATVGTAIAAGATKRIGLYESSGSKVWVVY
jgi:uncharacterized protein (TIGR02217 family)